MRNAQKFCGGRPFSRAALAVYNLAMDIFIFDDHDMMRKGLKAYFSDSSIYNIAGEAGDLEGAKKAVAAYKPKEQAERRGNDKAAALARNPLEEPINVLQATTRAAAAVAIVDVGFSSESGGVETVQGFELVKFIRQSGKNINCVMFSSYTGQAYIRNALSAEVGALAYVSKASESSVLVEAVNAAAQGKNFIDPYLSSALVTTTNVYDLLSKREREVLKYVQQGLPNSQIAANMNITERTVENHLSAIYSKAGTDNKTELVQMFGKL